MNCLALAAAGLLLRRPALAGAGLAALAILAIPAVGAGLLATLAVGPRPGPPPQAIVILSGDEQEIMRDAARRTEIGPATLERERAGAALARRTHLPILVSGGQIHPWSPPQAHQMAESLLADFATAVAWRETGSLDTWQNAQGSAAILHPHGIAAVYLVTHAWHMRRALLAFRAAGLAATPAPAAPWAPPRLTAASLVPSLRGWIMSAIACHEWLGIAAYRLRMILQ